MVLHRKIVKRAWSKTKTAWRPRESWMCTPGIHLISFLLIKNRGCQLLEHRKLVRIQICKAKFFQLKSRAIGTPPVHKCAHVTVLAMPLTVFQFPTVWKIRTDMSLLERRTTKTWKTLAGGRRVICRLPQDGLFILRIFSKIGSILDGYLGRKHVIKIQRDLIIYDVRLVKFIAYLTVLIVRHLSANWDRSTACQKFFEPVATIWPAHIVFILRNYRSLCFYARYQKVQLVSALDLCPLVCIDE